MVGHIHEETQVSVMISKDHKSTETHKIFRRTVITEITGEDEKKYPEGMVLWLSYEAGSRRVEHYNTNDVTSSTTVY